jgi:hypothetical protein
LFFTAAPARAKPLIIRPVNRSQIIKFYESARHETQNDDDDKNDIVIAVDDSLPFHAVTILSSK